MITSVGIKDAFDVMQRSFVIKTLNKVGKEQHFFNLFYKHL